MATKSKKSGKLYVLGVSPDNIAHGEIDSYGGLKFINDSIVCCQEEYELGIEERSFECAEMVIYELVPIGKVSMPQTKSTFTPIKSKKN